MNKTKVILEISQNEFFDIKLALIIASSSTENEEFANLCRKLLNTAKYEYIKAE